MLLKGSHRLFLVGAYEIWCNSYELPKELASCKRRKKTRNGTLGVTCAYFLFGSWAN
jgi:hypothetical protein